MELISVRQYAKKKNITRAGVLKQIKENRLPNNVEAIKVDTTFVLNIKRVMGKERMLLTDNYKKCFCGEKLKKINRFAVKLEAPTHINTAKRIKNRIYREKTIVRYCCEECYIKMEKSLYLTR